MQVWLPVLAQYVQFTVITGAVLALDPHNFNASLISERANWLNDSGDNMPSPGDFLVFPNDLF